MNDSGSPRPLALTNGCQSPDTTPADQPYQPDPVNTTPQEVEQRFSPNHLRQPNAPGTGPEQVSLNLSPVGQRSSTSAASGESAASHSASDVSASSAASSALAAAVVSTIPIAAAPSVPTLDVTSQLTSLPTHSSPSALMSVANPAISVPSSITSSPPGPITNAIQNSLGLANDYRTAAASLANGHVSPQIPATPGDYSNYYSAFYQAHADTNPLSHHHASYFPNHHFTVSSLIQKPGATAPYPKI